MMMPKRLLMIAGAVSLLISCASLPDSHRAVLEGASMVYVRQGAGSPTIVLEAGLGDDMRSWRDVIDPLSERSTVVAYNRAGYLPSGMKDQPRTPERIVDELRQLLTASNISPPYLLVGHSLGGAYMLNFAERYGEEVAGVVLVDARHPLFTRSCESRGLEGCALPAALRLLMPDHVLREYDGSQLDRMPATLGDTPLAVVSRSPSSGRESEQWLALWAEMQLGLSELSRRSRRFVAESAGHYVQKEEPELVVGAVEWVLNEQRELFEQSRR